MFRPAFGYTQHPKAGQNTQHSKTLYVQLAPFLDQTNTIFNINKFKEFKEL